MKSVYYTPARLAPLLALILCLVLPLAGWAQDGHTIEIRDGIVRLDGRVLEADELPPTLDTSGMVANLSFSGDAIFNLGGHAFAIREGKLVERANDDEQLTVTLRAAPRNFFFSDNTASDTPYPQAYELYVEALGDQAVRLERLREQMSDPQEGHAYVIANRMAEEAEQAAAIVRAFPRIELKSYLYDLQGRDEGLYEGIMQEQLMEMDSRKLAAQIRNSGDSTQRENLEKELESRLQQIFELKQQNRRQEIDQLAVRLDELRDQLAGREASRDRIIARRIEDLLTVPHE